MFQTAYYLKNAVPRKIFMKTKPFSQAALSLAVALALSACAAPKANPNLTLEATGQVMSAAETAERYDVNGNWWEIYQSPQLNALMEQGAGEQYRFETGGHQRQQGFVPSQYFGGGFGAFVQRLVGRECF